MIGTDTTTRSSTANGTEKRQSDVEQLLREARELLMQCRAAPSLVSGMYDEMMVPPLQRGIEQLESASVALASSTSVLGGPSSRGGALLAAKGFDHNKLLQEMSHLADLPTTQLEISQAPLEETDLDAFLESKFEERILGVVEELQARVREESERLVKDAKEAGWDRLKRLYLDKRQLLISEPGSSTATTSSSTLKRRTKPLDLGSDGNGRGAAFLAAVQRLNSARLSDAPFAPAFAFRAGSCSDDPILKDCWEAIAIIGNEKENEDQGNLFLSASKQSSFKKDSPDWTNNLIAGSKKFLEAMFSRYMYATVAQYPREAQLGGRPGAAERARAYATLRAQRMSGNEAMRLDLAPIGDANVPLWLVLWALFRSGHVQEAVEYAESTAVAPFIERSEPSFISYLKAYTSGTLVGNTLSQLRSDYAQRSTAPPSHDPYKLALLKLLGKCDLARKGLPDAVQTSEDYLWLQLSLLDGSNYKLSELQATVLSYGPTHFDPKGVAPLRYFQILCLVGLFEQAVEYLHGTSYQLEAVHVAITLAYHGLLAVSEDPSSNAWDLLLTKDGKCMINYGMLVNQYAKIVSTSFDILSGLQYIFLLTLVTWNPAYTQACRNLARQVVLEHPGEAASLLGDVKQDGSTTPGFLARHARLLGLAPGDNTAFMSEITAKTAERCEREGRLSDALQLYNLAGEYSRVMQLLLKSLASGITLPYQSDELASTTSTAQAIYQYYRGQDRIRSTLNPSLFEGLEVLLSLASLRRAVESSSWANAASILDSSTCLSALFPLDNDSTAITRAAERLRSPAALPEPLTSALPESLLLMMRALHGHFQELRKYAYVDPGRQAELDRIRKKARSLMLLVGLLRVRIQPEICAQLTRFDLMMN